jgi:NADPH:quinone reductase-like Zn-dependent oxidoreductase
MKAIAINEFGGPEKLELMDLPAPEPQEGEILIRVRAAGVNPVDWKIRDGLLKDRLPHRFPLILGWDAAGVVERVASAKTGFAARDHVYAYCRKPVVQAGTYAEYVTIPATSAAPKPRTMSFEEAATVPLAALTAYQCLFDAARLQAGETALIHAAAGGVGGFAVQLAKERGSIVLGTASATNHAYLRRLGVDKPIDYTARDFRESVRQSQKEGVDVIFDCAGGDTLERSVDVLKKGGRLVSIVDPAGIKKLKDAGINAFYVFVEPHQDELRELTRLIEAGRLRTLIAATFPVEQASKAHEMSKARHVRGKMVLTI